MQLIFGCWSFFSSVKGYVGLDDGWPKKLFSSIKFENCHLKTRKTSSVNIKINSIIINFFFVFFVSIQSFIDNLYKLMFLLSCKLVNKNNLRSDSPARSAHNKCNNATISIPTANILSESFGHNS